MEMIKLNNGIECPVVGIGTFMLSPADAENSTREALVKHWHGAADDSWFSHLAIEIPGEETSTEWCEAVVDYLG